MYAMKSREKALIPPESTKKSIDNPSKNERNRNKKRSFFSG